MSNAFDVDDFLAGIEEDKSEIRENTGGTWLRKVFMNNKGFQGIISMVPFLNKFSKPYVSVKGVWEWKGASSLTKSGELWYRILPKEMYGELTTEESRLYDEVTGYLETIHNDGLVDFTQIKRRNYTLIYGVPQSHFNTEKEEISENLGKACLFIYPSLAPLDAMHAAISARVQSLGGKKDWIARMFSPANTGRKGVTTISFNKSTGFGYDSTVTFTFNSEDEVVTNPDKVYEEDITKNFNDPIVDLLGLQVEKDTNRYFSKLVLNELRTDLIATMKDLEAKKTGEVEPALENKNGIQDPMKDAPSVSKEVDDDLPF